MTAPQSSVANVGTRNAISNNVIAGMASVAALFGAPAYVCNTEHGERYAESRKRSYKQVSYVSEQVDAAARRSQYGGVA